MELNLSFKDFELLVPNLEEVLPFYKDTLKLPMRFHNETFADFDFAYGSRLALWEVRHAAETCGQDAVEPVGNRMMASIRLKSNEEIDNAYAELKGKKVNLLQTPQTWPWGRYGFFFKDPNDFIWEVYTI